MHLTFMERNTIKYSIKFMEPFCLFLAMEIPSVWQYFLPSKWLVSKALLGVAGGGVLR
jgi:hypothetical protein